MIVRVTSKRQVTFPQKVMQRLGVKAGDSLVIEEAPEGFLIKPRRFSAAGLAPLRDKIPANLPAPDTATTRHAALDPQLRD